MTDTIQLRQVTDDDLPIFFEHQLDSTASYMAAFTRKDPSDRSAFDVHCQKVRVDPDITMRTILFQDQVAGHIASFGPPEEKELTYWLGREFWGRGIATTALAQFLREQKDRPLFARAAKDNVASIRVLEKCGFTICGHDRFFANARGQEIEEVILHLTAD